MGVLSRDGRRQREEPGASLSSGRRPWEASSEIACTVSFDGGLGLRWYGVEGVRVSSGAGGVGGLRGLRGWSHASLKQGIRKDWAWGAMVK